MNEADRDALGRLFQSQRDHRWAVATSTASERRNKLRALRRALVGRKDLLTRAMAADFGKHPAEVELTELAPTLLEINYAIRHLGSWMRPRRVPTPLLLTGTRGEIRYEPLGNVLIISPWNYHSYLLFSPLVAAMAAGNCVVIKPSEKVPATSAFCRQIIEDLFDPAEVAVVEGDAEVAQALLALPFDHIFFTGSTRVGRLVMRAAAEHLASVTLELGGKSPAVVDQSADQAQAALRIIWGKFINAGQSCVAPDYVLVHESRAEEFLRHASATLDRFYGPDAAAGDYPDLCRIVDQDAFRRLTELLSLARSQGAAVVRGGASVPEERLIPPTLLRGVTPDSAIMGEEVFGPILPVLSWRTLDEVVEIIRRGHPPLTIYPFTRDEAVTRRLFAATTSGAVVVNNTMVHLGNPSLPFGGVGPSGMGRYHGQAGFLTFSNERAVMRQGWFSFANLFLPPYTTGVRKRVDLLVRWLGSRW